LARAVGEGTRLFAGAEIRRWDCEKSEGKGWGTAGGGRSETERDSQTPGEGRG